MAQVCCRRDLVLAFLVSTFVTTEAIAQQTGAVTGEQKTLVIVGDFTDKPVSCSVSSIRSVMFDPTLSVAALYRDNSLGKVTVTGDIVGPYLLNKASTDPCNLSGLSLAAEAAAAASGVDVNAYPRRMYVLPPNACSGTGNGTVGGVPSYSWIYNCDIAGTFVHNFGHNLGLDHAGTAGNLMVSEIDDASDPMAWTSNSFRGLNAPHRQQLGWLAPNSVELVTQDGSFNIAPLGLEPTLAAGPQVLMIAKPATNEYYYLSYRRAVGFDRYIDGLSYDLLSVHQYKGDGSSTPTTLLARLNDGQSYVDALNGITVTLVSRTTSYATARVQFTTPACTSVSPTLNVSPASQSGAGGTSLSYSLTLINADTAACAPTTFALSRVLPFGWTGTVSPSSLTIGPGGTGQATLTVTSTSTATPGGYNGTVNASGVAATHAASASVVYTVQSLLDTVPPSMPLSLTGKGRQKQIDLSWIASSDNVRVAGYRVIKNGVIVGTSTMPSWTDTAVKPGSAYTYSVVAYDAAGNLSPPSDSITVVMSSGGKGR
jgi:hypothetical protein